MKIVAQMKGSTMSRTLRPSREYVDMVLRNAKMVENVELTVKGNTDEELARSLVTELIERGLARECIMDDDPIEKIERLSKTTIATKSWGNSTGSAF